jgi:hypothetical protein
MTVVSGDTPQNAQQLLANVAIAEGQREAASKESEQLRGELAARDERIERLMTTVDEMVKSQQRQPSPAPQPAAERPSRRERRDETPRKERQPHEKIRDKDSQKDLPGADNIGLCDLCGDKRNRRRFHIVGARRTPDGPEEEMDVCVGSCSSIAMKVMGGKIVGAKDASSSDKPEAVPETVEAT